MTKGARVGRNDPCPCGSGKKHKHCCLGREAGAQGRGAARVDRLLGLGPAVTEAMETIHGRVDKEGLLRALSRFAELAAEGGPLEELRFDPARFEAAVASRFEEALGRREEGGEWLVESCLPELADEALVDRVFDALAARLSEPVVLSEDRRAMAAAAVTTALATGTPGWNAMGVPALKALFRVQLSERMDRIAALGAGLREASEDGGGELSAAALAADPFFGAAATARVEAARRRVEAVIDARLLPPLLMPDEALYVTARCREPLAAFHRARRGETAEPEAAEAAFDAIAAEAQAALDGGLAAPIRARLLETPRDEASPPETKELARDLSILLDGRLVAVGLFGLGAVGARSEAEAQLGAELLGREELSGEDLGGYLSLLEESGEETRWLVETRRLLGAGPIRLR